MTSVAVRALRLAVSCTLPLWICAALLADVTVRYQSTTKAGPGAPPQISGQMEKMQSAWAGAGLRMKNGKQWSNAGPWTFIIDCTTQQMTLIDTVHHRFAHLSVAELPDKTAALMPKLSEDQRKAMPSMKTSVDSKKTGRMETILGIQAEEREMIMTMEMSKPSTSDPSAAPTPLVTMKMVMQVWTAKPEEALRNQAVRELTGYKLWTNYFMNPASMIEKMTAAMPDHGDLVKSMTSGLSASGAVMLRTHMTMYMSMPPELQKILAAQNPSVVMDPNAPLFEMNQEAVEVSSAPVEESLFQTPADYQEITPDVLLKDMMQSRMAAMDKKP